MANIPNEQIQSREIIPFIDIEFTPKSEKKTPEYSKSICKSVYSYYTNNKTEFSWEYGTKIDELRLIGQGRQSPDYYKRYFSSSYDNYGIDVATDVDAYFANSADANRYGWMNVIWDNLSPMGNIKTILKSILSKTDFDVRANVVDLTAKDEEDRLMTREYVLAKYRDQLETMRARWGLPSSQTQPMSDEYGDLLEIKKQGGFKQHYILALEQLMKWTEQYSDWDNHLKERFFDDIFDTRYGFACAEYKEENKPKWRWVDAKDVVVQSSMKHDFSDIDYGGFFDYPTINEIRGQDKLYNGEKYISTKDEWMQLGRHYAEYMGNPTKQDLNKVELDNANYSGKEGSIRLCRLNLYWKDYETSKEVEYKNRYGSKKRRAYKDGETVAKGDRLVESRIQKTYYARWIVGSEWMQEWGVMENMPRKNPREVSFPFIGVKLQEKSFTERLAPIAHMFAIAWIRLSNAVAKAQNDGYAIDVSALLDMDDGNKKLKWSDLIQMWKEESILLYDSKAQGPMGGTSVPIQKIQGTLLEDMTKELALMNEMYAKIEQLIGIPPVALGVSPGQDQAVRTTQMSVASSNTALDYLIGSVMRIKNGLAGVTSSMWQNAIKYSDKCRAEASKVIGSEDVEAIMAARDQYQEIGIELQARPSDRLKQEMLEIAKVEVGRKNQGQSGLDWGQYMELSYHFETGGSFLEALYRLKYWKKQDEKRIAAEKEAAIRQQGEVMDQNARTAAEEERKTEGMKSQQAMVDSQAKAAHDIEVDNNNFLNEMKKMRAEYELEQKYGVKSGV